ncbi:YjeF N-terminal domain-containing protein [Chlamydoabsidia padenii]|nr:YjeF N-terminal domain-containing protein [Chlamydoabsidia padenii]
MAEAFIGFHVSLTLLSGINLTGTVAHIEPNTQQMTLKDVTLFFPGQAPHHTPIYGVVGSDIADLQILPTPKDMAPVQQEAPIVSIAQQQQQQQQQSTIVSTTQQSTPSISLYEEETDRTVNKVNHTMSSTTTKARTTIVYSFDDIHVPDRPTQQKAQHKQQQNPTRAQKTEKASDQVKPTKSLSCTTDRKPKHHSKHHQRQSTETNGWANEDVNRFKEEEFDFQANLDMFDKAKVFAEIQEIDETASENLLVTLNRLPQALARKKQVNLLPSENVLGPTHTDDDDDDDHDDDDESGCGNESDNESDRSEDYDRPQRRRRNLALKKSVEIVTVNDGSACPVVSPLQMAHAEHECISVIGMNEDQMIENGSRGTFEVTVKLLDSRILINDNPRPLVLVLAGICKNGAYGLSTARRLYNHGHRVIVAMVEGENLSCLVTDRQKAMFERIGGTIVHGIRGLSQIHEQPHLVIDAMLGSQTKLVDLQDERTTYLSICDMIRWTNTKNTAPVLSIDYPSGVDAITGQHHHPMHHIEPQWTVCLGAPKTGCISSKVTGDLFMVDLGYPRLCWKKVGVKKCVLPWGASFVVDLKYL